MTERIDAASMDVEAVASFFAEHEQVVFGNGQQMSVPCVTIFHTDATGKIDATIPKSKRRRGDSGDAVRWCPATIHVCKSGTADAPLWHCC
jgi:hypothetical protein